jgi:hypothetical protein
MDLNAVATAILPGMRARKSGVILRQALGTGHLLANLVN